MVPDHCEVMDTLHDSGFFTAETIGTDAVACTAHTEAQANRAIEVVENNYDGWHLECLVDAGNGEYEKIAVFTRQE